MIHCYQLGGYNIVLDVCSGAVHAVDELAYDRTGQFEQGAEAELLDTMQKKYPKVPREELQECYGQISALREDGQLFTPDVLEPMAGKLKEKSSGVI